MKSKEKKIKRRNQMNEKRDFIFYFNFYLFIALYISAFIFLFAYSFISDFCFPPHITFQTSVMITRLCGVSCSDQGMEMGGLGSRRESQSGEKLTFESSMDPQRRKKKKAATIGKDWEVSSSSWFSTITRFRLKKGRRDGVDLKMCRFITLSDLDEDQADLVNGDAADQTTDGEEVVKKPRKKK